jgi:hypothetical protein
MQSFWDLLPASLWPTQPFIPPEESARTFQALRALQFPASSSSPATTGPNNLTSVRGGSVGASFGEAAGAPRATSFWDLLPPPPPGRPFVPMLPTPGRLDFPLAAAPAAGVAQPFASGPSTGTDQATDSSGILGPALTRSALGDGQSAATRQLATGEAQTAPPASIGELATRLPAIGAAAVRPLTDYLPTQGQYAREGVDEMREGWRNFTTRDPDEMTNHMGVGLSNLKGIAQMGLGAAGYLGSPVNAAIHTIIGQPVEDTTGIPSKYTDFAAGLALPFAKRLLGMSAPPAAAARVPAATPADIADAAETGQITPSSPTDLSVPRAVAPQRGAGAGAPEPASPSPIMPPLTGQIHHAISKRIYNALKKNPSLTGVYQYRDPDFVTRAIDKAAHRGYQKWHRELDNEIAAHIRDNPSATPDEFERYLQERYAQPDLLARFPNGL